MFIYNLTVKVDNHILQPWLQEWKEEHISRDYATNLFTENKFLRLLDQDDIDSSTYVVQYFTDTKEKYDKYLNEYASLFRGKAFEKWGNNFVAFRPLCKLCTNCAKKVFTILAVIFFPHTCFKPFAVRHFWNYISWNHCLHCI